MVQPEYVEGLRVSPENIKESKLFPEGKKLTYMEKKPQATS
jgi:hypothetical protein